MPAFFDKLMRAGEGRILRELSKIVVDVNAHETRIVAMSDSELRQQTELFKDRFSKGETLDDLLPEAFAVVREAAKRTLGQRHYDVQIMGGAALHKGNIAEMRTGEGKTLVATLPSYLNALAGRGVHVVTTNDYLAERDSEWMGRIHRFLGLKVGVILANMTPAERREAYLADITYGTNNEFGFDYLRDNMAWSLEECVQRDHFFAVVDEVDSILIDEARTPLIISGPADKATKWYVEFANLVGKLQRDVHYEIDEKKRTIGILEDGVTKVEELLQIGNLYEAANTPMIGYLNNAVRAKELFKRDKDYVVMNGELLIVDEHTGRMLAGRRYSEGLHQALEAKERIEIKDENQTLATITLQNYFRLYEKLSGMTGTAMTEASEFHQIYKLGVVPIPTNRSMIRIDQPDLVYKTEAGKFIAVTADIVEKHRKGQPVLVGTVSVEKSEELSSFLRKAGVPHEVLNAKHHEREAAIIARAGVKGAVTVATNMAGRGTDIMLGGNPEFMADFELQRRGISPVDDAEQYEKAWPEEITRQKAAVARGHEEVIALGGLYVLGTERHESRRIDNQLRGRSGRQGDPGESRFYLSLQDELMRRFNSGMVERFLTAAGIPEDAPIESKMVSNAIRSAQTQVESQNFEMRKNVLKYDDVMNRQRQVVYGERRMVLEGADIKDQVATFVSDTLTAYVSMATSEGYPEDWDLDTLWKALKTIYPISFTIDELIARVGSRAGLDKEFLTAAVIEDCKAAYAKREESLGSEAMRELERKVLLSVLDRKWREHLYEMDYLQEGIGLRAMAQRDPLVEYQREGFDLFSAMMDAIKEEIAGFLFNIEVTVEPSGKEVSGAGLEAKPLSASGLQYTAADESGVKTTGDVSRNAQCPCGSGKKYKRCHGAA
ncbi:MAG: preprotein translocase subunit SecA [Actinobacteria bacterium]|jgi:preprotein translocase subunit SecA|nr:preprotein translocase subunit SecA [Actinomycetota bacterium]NCV82596.1 preprotein translocase subunit SecA [Actinomycetota bacterium]NCW71626.1 preprotein translocase subunit SecA [Actinomycetota bacterium]NCX16061.1 preprotein translocase subunit SecA [Actinomycetota bacterium]NCX38429.1 preprotein translocase subunit SecA [Actinomycetota bacterium]